MGLGKKRVFVRKPYDKVLYKWSPCTAKNKATKKAAPSAPECTAEAGSQGEDWNTTYVYDKLILKGLEHRFAYVECDYVK